MVTITISLTLIKVPFDAYWSWCNDGFYYTIDNDSVHCLLWMTVTIPLTLIKCGLLFIDCGVMMTVTTIDTGEVQFAVYCSLCNYDYYYITGIDHVQDPNT